MQVQYWEGHHTQTVTAEERWKDIHEGMGLGVCGSDGERGVRLTWMWPGSLSCVASMNMAWATDGCSTELVGGGRKLATGIPPYLYTRRPSSRG